MSDDDELAASLVDEYLSQRIERAGDPPGLLAAVTARVAEGAEALRESMGHQLEHLDVRQDSRLPDAFLLDEGAVEDALQAVAGGYRYALALEGRLAEPRSFERGLSQRITPSTVWTVRCQASRVPRPATRPGILDWTAAPATWVGVDDPEWPPSAFPALAEGATLRSDQLARVETGPYAGWVQIALVERQASLRKRHPPAPSRQLILAVGVQTAPAAQVGSVWPLFTGGGEVWSRVDRQDPPVRDVQTAAARLQNMSIPLVGMLSHSAYPGSAGPRSGPGVHPFLLFPGRELTTLLGLRASAPRLRLLLVDGHEAALVCRQWSGYPMHDGDYGAEFPAIEGADLLMRPDLLSVMEDTAGQSLAAGVYVDVGPNAVSARDESATQ